jgi:hypothetical protein
MTAKDIADAARFEDELMRDREQRGVCTRCGWPHVTPEDDAACERQWRAKVKARSGRRVDGITQYQAGGALEDGPT